MNRSIKFRIWDKLEKRFIFADKGYQGHYVITLNGKFHNLQNGSGGDECIVQQWTGLKDRTGQDIYEGDICEWQWMGGPSSSCVENSRGEVFFEDGIFYFGRAELFCMADCNFMDHTLKIVGNIFENEMS